MRWLRCVDGIHPQQPPRHNAMNYNLCKFVGKWFHLGDKKYKFATKDGNFDDDIRDLISVFHSRESFCFLIRSNNKEVDEDATPRR